MRRRDFLTAVPATGAAGLSGVLSGTLPAARPARAASGCMPMLPEWAPHAACVMTWCSARDLYSREQLAWIHTDQVRIARAIAAFEPVIMLVSPSESAEAAQRLGATAQLVEIACNDIWARDTMPILGRCAGAPMATGWNFNVWGEKYAGQVADRTLALRYAEAMDLPYRTAPIVAEGGALETDGLGTLMTTETCLLNPNRNPGLSKAEVEAALKEYAPCQHVIWLWGSEIDRVTDGHVDTIARFLRPGLVVAEVTDDTEDPEFAELQENLRRLRTARDARGERLEVYTVKRPRCDKMPERGHDFAPSYVNAYFPNGGIVMATFGDEERDAEAGTLFARLERHRRVVRIAADQIAEGGGGIHCCTMQIPA